MNKKIWIFTVSVQIVCWGIIALLMFSNNNEAQAIGLFQLTPTPPLPFLGSIYYHEEEVWKIFDHNLPGNTINNNTVTHYDGVEHVDEGEYGYNGHLGIDYSVVYESVLAAASGTVIEAGWSDAGDHRAGYGLHMVMTHSANPDYETWYGHLSTLSVQTGDTININPADPSNTSRILGISGNTGHVFSGEGDCGTIPDVGPNCGQHLHFEVRNENFVLNPYGWIGIPGADPWDNDIGPTSYYLWANQPATESEQYEGSGPAGTPLASPFAEQDARFVIDSHSADFAPIGLCPWGEIKGDASFNGDYRSTATNQGAICVGQWKIVPDAFSPAGLYDMYAYMPNAANAALSAVYHIVHDGQVDQGIVVQAAYPNDVNSAWAYLGRFDFAMVNTVIESVRLRDDTAFNEDDGNHVLADAIRLVPSDPVPPPVPAILISFATDGVANGTSFADEDIMVYDADSSTWFLYFDGSDVGLSGVDVDAFYIQDDETILMSFDLPITLPGISPQVDDADIVLFTPQSLGHTTSGTFGLYQSGDQMGLNEGNTNSNIDAITFSPNGDLLISTIGPVNSFQDADLLLVDAGTLSLYFDGSDVGLTTVTEDIDGAWVDETTGQIYLSTNGLFGVTGSNGDGSDIFVCMPGSVGNNTTCMFGSGPGIGLFWNGSGHGFGKENVDGFSTKVACQDFLNNEFELRFLCWTVAQEEFADWEPSTDEVHSGQYSAFGHVFGFGATGAGATLTSQPLDVMDVGVEYRFSFYGKGQLIDPGESIWLVTRLEWYDGTTYLGRTSLPNQPLESFPTWTEFSSDFICPAQGADHVRITFGLYGDSLQTNFSTSLEDFGVVYVDDVTVESQAGACPLLNPSQE